MNKKNIIVSICVLVFFCILVSCGGSAEIEKISEKDTEVQKSLFSQAKIDITKDSFSGSKSAKIDGLDFTNLTADNKDELLFLGKEISVKSLNSYEFVGGELTLPEGFDIKKNNSNVLMLEYSFMPEIKKDDEEPDDIAGKAKLRAKLRKDSKDKKKDTKPKETLDKEKNKDDEDADSEDADSEDADDIKSVLKKKSNKEKYKKTDDEEIDEKSKEGEENSEEEKKAVPKPYKAQFVATFIDIKKVMDALKGKKIKAFTPQIAFDFTKKQLENYNIFWKDSSKKALTKSEKKVMNAAVGAYVTGYNSNDDYSNRFIIFVVISEKARYALIISCALFFPKFEDVSATDKQLQMNFLINCLKLYKCPQVEKNNNENVKKDETTAPKVNGDVDANANKAINNGTNENIKENPSNEKIEIKPKKVGTSA